MSTSQPKPVAMVTGATQYTGFTTAKLFAQRGYAVCITSRDLQKGEEAAARLRQAVPAADILAVQMTPSSIAETKAAFARVKAHFGRLDVFVANATAACRFKSILNTTEDEYDFIMDSNTKAYFFGTQAAAQLMIGKRCSRRHRADRIGAFPRRAAQPHPLRHLQGRH